MAAPSAIHAASVQPATSGMHVFILKRYFDLKTNFVGFELPARRETRVIQG